MKKRIALILLAVVCVLALSACGCEHEWAEANCSAPKTCSLCGETEGAPLGHSWMAATCSAPKTCEICGEIQGEALAHTWVDATCSAAKTCSVCGATEGDPLEHTWIDATYDAPKTCEVCGLTEGDPLTATLNITYDDFMEWLNYGLSESGYALNTCEEGSDGFYWDIQDTETGEALPVYLALLTASDGQTLSSVCGITSGVENAYCLGQLMGISMVIVDNSIDQDDLNSMMSNSFTEDDASTCYLRKNGLYHTLTEKGDELIFLITPET